LVRERWRQTPPQKKQRGNSQKLRTGKVCSIDLSRWGEPRVCPGPTRHKRTCLIKVERKNPTKKRARGPRQTLRLDWVVLGITAARCAAEGEREFGSQLQTQKEGGRRLRSSTENGGPRGRVGREKTPYYPSEKKERAGGERGLSRIKFREKAEEAGRWSGGQVHSFLGATLRPN